MDQSTEVEMSDARLPGVGTYVERLTFWLGKQVRRTYLDRRASGKHNLCTLVTL
jgi:hypothetical protein